MWLQTTDDVSFIEFVIFLFTLVFTCQGFVNRHAFPWKEMNSETVLNTYGNRGIILKVEA